MRKLVYVAFLAMVAFGLHCYTDYPLIVDEYTGEIINTNGKAKILPSSQIATIWPDGADNLFSMVDQKANGDQTLTTYNFYTTDGTYFYDDVYCSPDWNGCAIYTAPNPNSPDDDPFDITWNQNCLGSRSLLGLMAAVERYTECGRSRLTVRDQMRLMETGTLLDEFTLGYRLHAGNTSLFFDNNAGARNFIPILGDVRAELDVRGRGRVRLVLDNPLVAHSFRSAADWQERYGTSHTTVTLTLNGIRQEFDIALLPEGLRGAANRL